MAAEKLDAPEGLTSGTLLSLVHVLSVLSRRGDLYTRGLTYNTENIKGKMRFDREESVWTLALVQIDGTLKLTVC